MDPEDEATMRIGEVARRTGLTTATIRAWQRRYGVLSPARSEGHQRLYSTDDVAILLDVSARVAEGWALAAAAEHVMQGRRRPDGDAPAPPAADGPRRDGGGAIPATPGPVAVADPQGGRSAPPAPEPGGAQARTRTEVRPAPAQVTERDHFALVAVHDASRTMLRASRPADVVAALVDLVVALGGTVGPAAEEGDDLLPTDLGLGEAEPLLARAEPYSVARLRLEAVLPGLVEDGRRMVALLRAAGR